MPTIREVLTKFSFQTDDGPLKSMRGALQAVGADMRKTFDTTTIKDHVAGLERVRDAGSKVKDSFGGIADIAKVAAAGVAAIGAAATGTFALVKGAADYADSIKDTSDQLGIASGELQALGYVAQLSGSNTEELGNSLRFLSKNAVSAAEDAKGPAADGFRKLGVSVKDANGNFKSSTQLLEEMSDGFANLPEGPQRTALAMELLGKSGVQMVPLLSQGSAALAAMKQEAYDLGAVMGDDALNAGAAFNDEMDKLTAVANGIRNMVGGALLPIMTQWVGTLKDLIVANKDIIATRLEIAVKFITDAMATMWRMGVTLYETLTWLADKFGGLENILKVVGVLLLGLGGAAVLSAIGTAAIAIGGLVAAMLSLNMAAISAAASMAIAWLAAAAIPILIGAAIVAVLLAFEDIWTYLQGGESVFGKWVEWVYGLFDKMKDWAKGVGIMIYDAIVQPIKDAFNFVSDYAKDFLGIDKDTPWIPETVGPKKSKSSAMDLQNGVYNPAGPSAPWIDVSKPVIAPTPMVELSSGAAAAGNINLENSIVVNANGLNEEEATRVASAAARQSQADLFKRAGQNSVRKNRE